MAFELFGPVPGVLAILAVLPAYAVIGRRGALLGQDVGARKLRRGRPAAPRCGTPEEPPPTATPGGAESRAEREAEGELAGRR